MTSRKLLFFALTEWSVKKKDVAIWCSLSYNILVKTEVEYQSIPHGKPTSLGSPALAVQFSSIQLLSRVQLFATHGLQHSRLPCPSPTPRNHSNSCPSSQWCHPNISSSVIPFSSCLQSCPASGSFQMSQFFTSGGQSIGVSGSASVLPMNIQD